MSLAIIAGQGDLPGLVAEHVAASGNPPLICELDGIEPKVSERFARLSFRLETLGTLLEDLQTREITQLCMIGSITRPEIDPSQIDRATLPLVPHLQDALSKGDDGALRVVIEMIEETGIEVIGAHELLPDLLPTATESRATHAKDAALGENQVAQMGRVDLGQACIVSNRQVVMKETDTGTDVMLASLCSPTTREEMPDDPLVWIFQKAASLLAKTTQDLTKTDLSKAILFKAPKPNQDRRVDLPTIGPKTAMLAAEAGLAGIVIEAGGVMVLDQPQVADILTGHGMFLWVREATT